MLSETLYKRYLSIIGVIKLFNFIRPGDVCILDPNNDFKLTSDKINYVKVVGIALGGVIRSTSIYKCIICDRKGKILNETVLNIPGKQLIPNGSHGDNVIIRYPKDIPVFSKEDLSFLKELFDKYKEQSSNEDNVRLAKIIAKVEFFVTTIREY